MPCSCFSTLSELDNSPASMPHLTASHRNPTCNAAVFLSMYFALLLGRAEFIPPRRIVICSAITKVMFALSISVLASVISKLPHTSQSQHTHQHGVPCAGWSDWLDGWAARRFDQQSVIGTYLDPLADKALMCCAVTALGMQVRLCCLLLQTTPAAKR